MLPPNESFTREEMETQLNWLRGQDRYWHLQEINKYKRPAGVKTIFFGDSITQGFPLDELFTGKSILNRGIGGDTIVGFYCRLEDDVLNLHPEQVVMMGGINGIEKDPVLHLKQIHAVAKIIKEHGSRVYLASITPLRNPDAWNRFQYQERIVQMNKEIKKMVEAEFSGYVDYHTAMKDADGQLRKEFVYDDGTHIRVPGYEIMADVVKKVVEL